MTQMSNSKSTQVQAILSIQHCLSNINKWQIKIIHQHLTQHGQKALPKSNSIFHATFLSSSSFRNVIVTVTSESKPWWCLVLKRFATQGSNKILMEWSNQGTFLNKAAECVIYVFIAYSPVNCTGSPQILSLVSTSYRSIHQHKSELHKSGQ